MIQISATGYRDVKNYLDSLKLPPGKQRQLHRALARKVAGYARRNVRNQSTVGGGAMKERAPQNPDYDDGKQRGKMLKRITKEKHMKAIGETNFGKVYWKDSLMGMIAARQQEGAMIERSRRGRERSGSGGWGRDPATKAQAMRLLKLGAKIRNRKFKPNVTWIRQNLTINQAGAIIRSMEGNDPDSWKRASELWWMLPSRPFLGVSPRENAELLDVIEDLLARYR